LKNCEFKFKINYKFKQFCLKIKASLQKSKCKRDEWPIIKVKIKIKDNLKLIISQNSIKIKNFSKKVRKSSNHIL